MATDIVIPKLGMTMEKATINEWLLKEGDRVEVGRQVLVIETEKVTYEVEALGSGLLHILHGHGYVAQVGEPVGRLAADPDELEALQSAEPGPESTPAQVEADTLPADQGLAEPTAKQDSQKVRISPAAKKMVRDHNLDATRIAGSGPCGRIKVEDVKKYLEDLNEGKTEPCEKPAPDTPIPAPPWNWDVLDGKRVKDSLPLTGLRAAVAEHMLRSLSVSAQLTTMGEFDAGELVKMRESLKSRADFLGVRISYTDIMVYILARALKRNPIINSSLTDDAITLWEDVHIGVAVSLPWEKYDAGLIVPVVKNADQKSLVEISREITRLRESAVAGTLALDEITSGTFTLSNVGAFGKGYTFGTPVINQPQSAIMMIGGIVKRPIIKDDAILVRPVMNWSFTFDHRVINGAPAGKFIQDVEEYLNNPAYLMLA